MSKRAIIRLSVLLLMSVQFLSCATTTTFWIPIYQISSGGYKGNTSIDPDAKVVINPVEGACLAYYKGDSASSVVFSNTLNLSFSNKVVLKNNKIDESQSTGEVISNLSIWKSFYYDPALTSSEQSQGLFILKDGLLAALDHDQLNDGQLVEYTIAGQNSGTDALQEIIILDVLPKGFKVESSEYWFQENESGTFEHKILSEAGKDAVVFVSKLIEPMAIGDSFLIKIRIGLDLDKLNKEFY